MRVTSRLLLVSISLVLVVFSVAQSALIPKFLKGKLAKRPFTERECLMCKFSVSLANYALQSRRGAERVTRITNSFCTIAQIESPLVCSQVTKLFNSEVVKVLSYGLVNPSQVCGFLSNNTCGTYHNPLDNWEVNLNVSATLSQDEIAKLHKNLKALEEPQQTYRVIHISDTHVDLRYAKGSYVECDEPLCCRPESKPINASTTERSGYWGAYGHCDIPLNTFVSALQKLNSTIETGRDIDYIIWTGDIQPHDVWMQNKETALQTYDVVFENIFKYLPKVKIFPTLGNHEMVPVDSFSPSNLLDIAREDAPEWLYRKLDSYWSRWLPNETVPTITKDGFYAAPVRPGLRVVSLNTNFCHKNNFWLYINSTDPGNQLEWLIHELQISELEHEKVHIIGHIPPGIDDCLKVWSKNYNRIVRRFSKTIAGQFFGHTHQGEFEIFYDQNDPNYYEDPTSKTWTPASVGFIGSSITTFIDLNPSFKIYTVDPGQGYAIRDIETIIMNLTAANSAGPLQEVNWTSAGLFTQTFDLKDTSPQSMHNLLLELVGELKAQDVHLGDANSLNGLMEKSVGKSTGGKLYKLYRLFNSFSDKFSPSQFEKLSGAELRDFLCRFFKGQSHDMNACERFIHGGQQVDANNAIES